MVFHRFLAFLTIEERRIHRAGADSIYADAALAKLLGSRAGEMLHRRLAAGVHRIKGCIGCQQRTDDGHDAAVIRQMLACLLNKEKCRLGVDVKTGVVIRFGHLGNRFFDHQPGGIDRNIHLAERLNRFLKHPRYVGRPGQIALHRYRLRTRRFNRSQRFFRRRPRRVAVVMHHYGRRAAGRQIARHQATQILRATGDQHDFSIQRLLTHDNGSVYERCPEYRKPARSDNLFKSG
ncbi:hypothetical protein D3C79_563620 [compost metagenome]